MRGLDDTRARCTMRACAQKWGSEELYEDDQLAKFVHGTLRDTHPGDVFDAEVRPSNIRDFPFFLLILQGISPPSF